MPTKKSDARIAAQLGDSVSPNEKPRRRISATIITLNEERNIAAAIESLSFADEIIVVDSGSTDRTLEIARGLTQRVYVKEWRGYSAQKNFAAAEALHDWIFSLDADERVSPDLATEIDAFKSSPDQPASAYEMSRLANYLGGWIRHSGWYPDRKVRLYDRRKARWVGDFVHEELQVDGVVKRISGDLLHYTVRTVSEHVQRSDRYTTLAAEEMLARGRTPSILAIALAPPVTFFRSYVLKLGLLDGIRGVAIAFFAAYYVFLKNLKSWRKANETRTDSDNHDNH